MRGHETARVSLKPNLRISTPFLTFRYLLWFEADEVFNRNWLVVYDLMDKKNLSSREVSLEIPNHQDVIIWRNYLVIKTNKFGNSSTLQLYNFRKMEMEREIYTTFSLFGPDILYSVYGGNSFIELHTLGGAKTLLPRAFESINDIRVLNNDVYVFGATGPNSGSNLIAKLDLRTLGLYGFTRLPNWIDARKATFSTNLSKIASIDRHSILIYDSTDFRLLNKKRLTSQLRNIELFWYGDEELYIISDVDYAKKHLYKWSVSTNSFDQILEAQRIKFKDYSLFFGNFRPDGNVSLNRYSLVNNSTSTCVSNLSINEQAIDVNFDAIVPYYLTRNSTSNRLSVHPWGRLNCNQSLGPEIKTTNNFFSFRDGSTSPVKIAHLFIENKKRISYWQW